ISPFPPSGLLALAPLAVPRRIAVIHNVPGRLVKWIRFYGAIYGLGGFFMERLLRRGLLQYDRIICVNNRLADELKRHPRIAARVRSVPNGVEIKRPLRIENTGKCSTRVRLLTVGRLVPMKGQRYLIEAIALLHHDHPSVSLTILGGGPLKKRLAYLA